MATASMPMASPATAPHKSAPSSSAPITFEFTKRKRWADLLITELADTTVFILSPQLTILYCSPAITELLGWKELDIVDHDFTELVNAGDDQRTFRACFEDSLRRRSELLVYVRLKCNSPGTSFPFSPMKEILFELKGYAKFAHEEDTTCQCFFAMAKPYLSRNIALLNTMMELQLENEQLQQKLKDLKHSNASYTSSGIMASDAGGSNHYYPPGLDKSGYDSNLSSKTPVRASFDASSGAGGPSSGGPEEEVEDGQKKKKAKKTHPNEQYVCVTCGRTDSPEWRKGPLGPKTLCNACGLRWAKQMRKTDDTGEGGADPPPA
ncbi:GATA-domain-containing protein [Dendrothele bispora CBS 962.96]|uniref:GATA-domain-containing protein n=1 Tax=Dendrothele bispora (strain CBS 962.96) TaxID=1314807 RepID=A0A4S8LI15_DENBC|nr:GATA-domain-containing protein [Dendrothele bispora CBS 962.96]THU96364.1 GATA-domain-containing protein [Dendrothele bispora CBS 962.96]